MSTDHGRLFFMIDLKFLRDNPDVVRASQITRGEDPALVDELISADESRREAIKAADDLRAEQKAFGKKIGQASPEDRPALLEGSNELKAKVKDAEAAQEAAEAKVNELQMKLSNVVSGALLVAKMISSSWRPSASLALLISSQRITWSSVNPSDLSI